MDNESLFWGIADDLMARDRVEEGTMMGHRCLRAGGGFAAMLDRSSGGLIVKLAEGRVTSLIDQGAGRAFAPAGKVFREWVLIPEADPELWKELIVEAVS